MFRKLLALSAVASMQASVLAAQETTLGRLTRADRPSANGTRALVVDGVTVVDVKAERLVPAQRVIVVGNRIQAVGGRHTVKMPRGARVVDARGKYLIPGLWDMHVHIWQSPRIFYPLFIAHGVTGVRDMSTASLDSVLQWRREIATGTRVGPRMVVTGPFLESVEGVSPALSAMAEKYQNFLVVTTTADGRRAVDSLQAAGADFIKVRNGLSRELYTAIAAEARRIGIPVVGHIPSSVTAAEASDNGQRSVEHYVGYEVCGREADAATTSASTSDSLSRACAALIARFLRNDTWITPTFAVRAYFVGAAQPPDRLRYWPAAMRTRSSVPPFAAHITPLQRGLGRLLLAGTDTSPWDLPGALPGAAFNVPGLSLHDELSFLVQWAGLTPLEALRTATLNPATFLHATDSLGTIEAGKLADLVLLDADPSMDIANTTKVRAVVANGRYYDRAALDQLLADARQP